MGLSRELVLESEFGVLGRFGCFLASGGLFRCQLSRSRLKVCCLGWVGVVCLVVLVLTGFLGVFGS